MYNSSGLIPARFLILIAHFIICTTLLWNKQELARVCLTEEKIPKLENVVRGNYLTQWMTGIILMILFMCIEIFGFVFGLTIFDSNSALLSIAGHSGSCIFLSGLILNDWHCGWFWWIFSLGSVMPLIYDTITIFDQFIQNH